MADRTMSLSAEVATLERKARSESAKLRGQLFARLRIIKAYRRVFLEPGAATEQDQRLVLGDLIDQSDLGRAAVTLDAQALAAAEGQRRTILHIFGRFRLDDERLRQLRDDLTEATTDEE
jgi:hypothetical protein